MAVRQAKTLTHIQLKYLCGFFRFFFFADSATELRFLGADFKPVFEPGEIEIRVGPCSDSAQLVSSRLMLRA